LSNSWDPLHKNKRGKQLESRRHLNSKEKSLGKHEAGRGESGLGKRSEVGMNGTDNIRIIQHLPEEVEKREQGDLGCEDRSL